MRGLARILMFALGLMVSLTLYGMGLAYIGQMVGFSKIQYAFFLVAGILAYGLGLRSLKLLQFELPQKGIPAWTRKMGWGSPFFVGLLMGNLGVGCPDPVLYVLLLYLANVGDVGQGAVMTAAYSAGRSLPIIGLAILGLLGANVVPAMTKRQGVVERVMGWSMVIVGALFLSTLLFGEWFESSWIHEGWNWALHRLNANWGELGAGAHTHDHGAVVPGPILSFVVLGFVLPAVWRWRKGETNRRAVVRWIVTGALVFLVVYLPTAIDPQFAHRFGSELRQAPGVGDDGHTGHSH